MESSNQRNSELLVAENLHKSYGNIKALDGLTFSLKSGRIMGFLGPNGAGKTTAIRILTTIIQQTSGTFSIYGIKQNNPEKIRKIIGVLPESSGFPEKITALEYLIYYGRLYGLKTKQSKLRASELLKEVGLEKRSKTFVSSFSRGMRQRLGIARALINKPVILFLDEPTLGLDPKGQGELLGLLKKVASKRKVGIILCSHLLSEIEEVCDDVVILNSGKLIAKGTVREIVSGNNKKHIEFSVPVKFEQDTLKLLKTIEEINKISQKNNKTNIFEVELKKEYFRDDILKEKVCNKILKTLLSKNIPIINFESEGGRLQDVFLQLTGK